MTTIREMIETHNELARTLDQPELTAWKQAGDKLLARIEAMQAVVEADAADADQALLDSALDGSLMASIEVDPLAIDPLTLDVSEASSAVEPDAVSPNGAEEPGDDQDEPVVPSRGVGKLIASLLVDPEGFDYAAIVEMVVGEFPAAKTSRRSIASVAAGLRRKGVEVPMRRNAKC